MSLYNPLLPPVRIQVQTDDGWYSALTPESFGGESWWRVGETTVGLSETGTIAVRSTVGLKRIHLRWDRTGNQPLSGVKFLGDHWERGYGDLGWIGYQPERVMPWYFLSWDGQVCDGYGVKTGAAAFCFWQADETGLSLWLDLRCGGRGVQLGPRVLAAATIVTCGGISGETPFAVSTAFCQLMAPDTRDHIPKLPVYGGNNWYSAYGRSSADDIRRDADVIAEAASGLPNRPFMVIDDGWQSARFKVCSGGPWKHGNYLFPDMAALADDLKARGTKPGLWCRPTLTRDAVPDAWAFDRKLDQHMTGVWSQDAFLDISHPDCLEDMAQTFGRFCDWGYQMIKYDFSTWDIFGRWGFQMGAQITDDGWSFGDTSRTSAEIVRRFYQTIYDAVGTRALLIGCNTVSHLAAGLVHLQRTGDDTSGREWERTRKMGVNTLAFRMPQHDSFYAVDADCVGLTTQVPLSLNLKWLDVLAGSGTPLFVSTEAQAVTPEVKVRLREAFHKAARTQSPAEPLDWLETTCPRVWKQGDEVKTYDWYEGEGVRYFPA